MLTTLDQVQDHLTVDQKGQTRLSHIFEKNVQKGILRHT